MFCINNYTGPFFTQTKHIIICLEDEAKTDLPFDHELIVENLKKWNQHIANALVLGTFTFV